MAWPRLTRRWPKIYSGPPPEDPHATRPQVPGTLVVALAASLVPRNERVRWREEWWAELVWAWGHPTFYAGTEGERLVHVLVLFVRALGSVADALEMRRIHGGDPMTGRLVTDLRVAFRALSHRRGYAVLLALTLALGIGATTAVFTVVDTVLLRPLPFQEPERLAALETGSQGGYSSPYFAPAFVEAWAAQRDLFEEVASYTNQSLVLEDGEPRDVRAVPVSSGFFQLFGVAPRLGRTILAEDIDQDARVAVVSDELWRSVLGGDTRAVGRAITLNGERYTVIGVMPPSFRYPIGQVALWLPLAHRLTLPGADGPPVQVGAVARMARGITLAAAQARADALAPRIAVGGSDIAGGGLTLRALDDWRANPDMRRALLVLAGAALFVLLIACANAANLLLVRATTSRRELAVRMALGATRYRLILELLTEAGVLALAGGAMGVLLAFGGVRAIIALAPSELTRWSYGPIEVDMRVLGFAVVLSFVTVLVAGVLPALQATAGVGRRRGMVLSLTTRTGAGTREQRHFRRALVVGQLALSVMLLVGAGLLIHSFMRLATVAPGMQVERLALLDIMPDPDRYASLAERIAFYESVTTRMGTLPGVEAVSVVGGVAGSSLGLHLDTSLEVEGADGPIGGDPVYLPYGEADTSYFHALGIPILEGRAFDATDIVPQANTAIIDQDLARHLWPDGRAVGRRFRVREKAPWLTVVGVAGDVKLMGPDDRQHPFEIYYPRPFGAGGQRTIAVRTAGDPALLLSLLKAVVHQVDPRQPVASVTTAAAKYRESLVRPRFFLTLMVAFAGAAAVLATIGLYGVVAYSVAQRTRDIGVRMALGARREQVMTGVMLEALALTATGLLIGLAGALTLGRVLGALLFDVRPTDPFTFAVVMALLGVMAVMAAYMPAVRASRIDPMNAMRAE